MFFQGGFTPLHFASRAGHLEVVCLLVESGASPAHETKDGKVPLNFAAANNHADVLSFLLKKEHDTHRLMDDKKVENIRNSWVILIATTHCVCVHVVRLRSDGLGETQRQPLHPRVRAGVQGSGRDCSEAVEAVPNSGDERKGASTRHLAGG